MKYKIKKKFECMEPSEGTTHKEESKTDRSQAEETNIYACLRKYGMQEMLNKTMAKEQLYLDNTNRNMTLDEAVRQRNDLEEYFKQQPAKVRKVFGDNVDQFVEKYRMGEFDDFLSTGVLTKEQIEAMKGEENVKMEENINTNASVPTDTNKINNPIDGGDNRSEQ